MEAGRCLSAWCSQQCPNRIQHSREILINVLIAQADDPATLLLFNPAGAFGIVLGLIGVRIAIDFNDELGLRAVEVDDEAAHRVLPAELMPIKLPVPEVLPQPASAGVSSRRSCRARWKTGWTTASAGAHWTCHGLYTTPGPVPVP